MLYIPAQRPKLCRYFAPKWCCLAACWTIFHFRAHLVLQLRPTKEGASHLNGSQSGCPRQRPMAHPKEDGLARADADGELGFEREAHARCTI